MKKLMTIILRAASLILKNVESLFWEVKIAYEPYRSKKVTALGCWQLSAGELVISSLAWKNSTADRSYEDSTRGSEQQRLYKGQRYLENSQRISPHSDKIRTYVLFTVIFTAYLSFLWLN